MFLATLPAAAAAIRLPGLRVGRAGHAQMVAEPAINAPPPTPPYRQEAAQRADRRPVVRPHQLAGGAPGGHALDRRVRRRRRDRGDVRLPLRPRDVDDAAAAGLLGAADRRRAARRVVVRLPRAAREAGGRRVVAGEPADGGAEAAAVVLVHRARRRAGAAVGARGGARRDRVPRDRQHAVGVALARLRPRALAVGVDDARLRRARRRDVDDVVEV